MTPAGPRGLGLLAALLFFSGTAAGQDADAPTEHMETAPEATVPPSPDVAGEAVDAAPIAPPPPAKRNVTATDSFADADAHAEAMDAYLTQMLWNDPGRAQRALFSLHPEYGLFAGQDAEPIPLARALRIADRPDVADAAMAQRRLLLWGKTVPSAGLLATGIAALAAANATGIGLFLWSDLSGDAPAPQLPVPARSAALAVMLGGSVAGMAAVLAGAVWIMVTDVVWGAEIEPAALNVIVRDHNAARAAKLGLNPIDDPLPSGVVEGEMRAHPVHSCLGLGCMSCRGCSP